MERALAGPGIVLVVVAMIGTASAAPRVKVPDNCSAAVSLKRSGEDDRTHKLAGTVKSITKPTTDGPFEVTLDDGAKEQSFLLYFQPRPLPFAVGDAIKVEIERSAGWHRVYDGVIRDASDTILVIAASTGRDGAWADGWTVSRDRVVEARQREGTRQRSVRRVHEVRFKRGKVNKRAPRDGCVLLQDGDQQYLAQGGAVSWDGLPPPEGVDYKSFSLIRWPIGAASKR